MSQSGFRAVSERFQTYARSKVNNLGQAKGYFVNYKARRMYFRVLLCITKLADRTSQCYFVLQSLQNALPNTTLYCKARRSTSQHYFVLPEVPAHGGAEVALVEV